MASVHDVAAYILKRESPMSTWKLQKLVYYAQAWHLAWDERPLFGARIEAWANGPVVPEIYRQHRGKFSISFKDWKTGDLSKLRQDERATIDAVLAGYGKLDGRQLSHLTHNEDPWKDARGDLPATASSSAVIKPEAMQQFYGALDLDDDAQTVDSLDWSNH
jgi:uncharacterized phage-associated protein